MYIFDIIDFILSKTLYFDYKINLNVEDASIILFSKYILSSSIVNFRINSLLMILPTGMQVSGSSYSNGGDSRIVVWCAFSYASFWSVDVERSFK